MKGDGPLASRVIPTTTFTINTTYLTRAPNCRTLRRNRRERVRVERGTLRSRRGLSCSCLVRRSKPVCGHVDSSRLRVGVHRRYNGRGVREPIMRLTVPIHRDEVSHLGSTIESVVIDRVRTGRVLVFVTRPPDVADERSVSEARGRDYSIRHHPSALVVPLGTVLTIRISIKNQQGHICYSHTGPDRLN